MGGRVWTPEEIALALACADEKALAAAAPRIGRTFNAIKSKRLRTLNPPPPKPKKPRKLKKPRPSRAKPKPTAGVSHLFGRRSGEASPAFDANSPSEAAKRRGATRRSIEDMQSELHLRRLLEDEDW